MRKSASTSVAAYVIDSIVAYFDNHLVQDDERLALKFSRLAALDS
jgi:hypothetical protein